MLTITTAVAAFRPAITTTSLPRPGAPRRPAWEGNRRNPRRRVRFGAATPVASA